MSKIVRIQIGHYPRKTGSTGAYNRDLQLSEQSMNKLLADHIQSAIARLGIPKQAITWQFIGADERLYSKCDMFISLHMDGNNDPTVVRGSVGYPPSSKTSATFAQLFKAAYVELGLPNSPLRDDNYSTGLRFFYAFKAAYSHYAPVKMVFENGFITNNGEARWAQDNMDRVAEMLVKTIASYYGVNEVTYGDPSTAYKEIKEATGNEWNWAVRLWQQRLNVWAEAGPISEDGLVGPQTEAAHRAWSKEHSTLTTSRPGRFQWRKLLKDPDEAFVPPTPSPPPVVEPEPEGTGERTYTEAELIFEIGMAREESADLINKLVSDLGECQIKIVGLEEKLGDRQGSILELETLVKSYERTLAEQAGTIKDMIARAARAREILNGQG